MLGPMTFTDPREVAAYWDRFKDRSVTTIQPYLWSFPEGTEASSEDPDNATISPVRRSELDHMALDESREFIKVDPAVYLAKQNGSNSQSILVLSNKDQEDSYAGWQTEVVLALQSREEAEKFIAQLSEALDELPS